MTALCGGGTSGPKTGVAAVVDYSSGLIAAVLAARGLNWLIPVIPLAGLPPLILSTFCGTDPPAIPTFTTAETNAIIQLTFGADFDSGIGKLSDLLLHTIWYDACQCTSGSPTTFPTITPPTGTPITLPPVPASSTPCWQQKSGLKTFPLPIHNGIVASFDHFLGISPTLARLTASTTTTVAPGRPVRVDWNFIDEGGATTLKNYFVALGVNSTFQLDVPIPVGATRINMIWNDDVTGGSGSGTGSGSTQLNATYELWCNAIPGGVQQPCCPPDVATQSQLDLILRMVTLIQRQSVPFAYIPSTTHPSLSGAGVIDISGLLGCIVDVTTLPTPLGRHGTSPTEYFDMGFVTFGTLDGYPQSYRLERSGQLMLPARAGLFTQLAYDLHPGVVCTITELVREP
jgi:hypothetical protein